MGHLVRCLVWSVIVSTIFATGATAAIRVDGSPGGNIGYHIDMYRSWRDSGQVIQVAGPCLSACTLMLGIVPKERICITKDAKFGFHAASDRDAYRGRILSVAGTQLLWNTYPPSIRSWIAKRGGLTANMIYLEGAELALMYKHCS